MGSGPAIGGSGIRLDGGILHTHWAAVHGNGTPRMRTISTFHYATVFLDGVAFTSDEHLHSELAFKLGLPQWYGRNFDALLDCLSSIDNAHENLCNHWELQPGKRMVLQVRGLPMTQNAKRCSRSSREPSPPPVTA